MKRIIYIVTSVLLLCLVACGSSTETKSELDIARENVVEKWKNEAGVLGTSKYIEDIYKQYPDDETISNIYFCCIAKDELEWYESMDDTKHLESAKEFASNIDPNYSGELSEEILAFANELLEQTPEERKSSYLQAKQRTDRYNNLTNSEKKEICEYIQSRYDYYDSVFGGDSGDTYSDKIWEEASAKYDLTTSQLDIIWMYMYEY